MKKLSWIVIICTFIAGCSRSPETAARTYCNAALSGDAKLFKSLFVNERQKAVLCEPVFERHWISECQLLSVTPPYAEVRYRYKGGDTREKIGSLYILPNGSIKYDPIFLEHPALSLRSILLVEMNSDDVRFRQDAERVITLFKIPAFGYGAHDSPEARAASIQRMQNWINENESTFDVGTQKLPLSSTDLARAKESKRRIGPQL